MDLQQLLKPYKRKIALDAAIKAVAIALLVGLVTVLTAALALGGGALGIKAILTYSIPREIPFWVDILLDGAAAAASIPAGIVTALISGIITFVVVYKKGSQGIAKQVDSLGLDERLVTMIEYQNDPSYVAYVQRQDAQKRLSELNFNVVKVKFPAEKIISAVALLLSILLVFATVPLISNAIDRDIEPPDDNTLLDSLEKIDDIIDEAPITEDKKEELQETIDDLKDKLEQQPEEPELTPSEKQEAIEETKKELEDFLEEEQEKIKSLIEALKEDNITEELGYAIEELYNACQKGAKEEALQKGKDAVNAAMENLQAKIENSRITYEQLSTAITSAIMVADKGITDDMHALKVALQGFCENLKEMEEVDNSATAVEATILATIESGFEESKNDIIEAVVDIKDLEETIDKIEESFNSDVDD